MATATMTSCTMAPKAAPMDRRSAMGRTFAPSPRAPLPRRPVRQSHVVAAAPSFLIAKLESSAQTHKELTFRLADPDVASDAKEFQKLSKALG